MGRKRLYSEEEIKQRVLQQKKEYYNRNKEKIARQNKLWRLKKLGIIKSYEEPVPKEKSLTDVLKEWNGQLYQHIQTNIPQWLEMALKLQLNINTEFINQHEQKKPRI